MTTGTRLTNKVALVTGSSSGIGRAIALRYAAEGAKVVCADLSPELRVAVLKDPSAQAAPQGHEQPTHELIGHENAAFVQTDVGEASAVENAVQLAVRTFGRLDM
jgi:NAD(P)-dependent dehydrogenase (short-subunit alcohol dehydrogenase family)